MTAAETGAADSEVTYPTVEDDVTDTLLNILAVDLPAAVINTSGDADLYKTTTAAVDTTIIASFAAQATQIDAETGEIIYIGHDPDARNLKRTPTRRDRDEFRTGYKLEAVIPTLDIPLNRTEPSKTATRLPGAAIAYRFHNDNHSPHQTVKTLRLLAARGRHLSTVTGDLGFTNSIAEKWATPLRALGIDPVHDLKEHTRTKTGKIRHRSEHRGLRPLQQLTTKAGEPDGMLVTIDGTVYEQHIANHLDHIGLVDLPKPEWVVIANQNPERAAARKQLIHKYDQRTKFAWREHDRPTPDTHRLKGPAHGTNRTAWCANHPKTRHDGHKRHLPKTPCQPDDNCHCAAVVTLPNTANAKFRQRRPWGTTGWQHQYAQRSLAESHFATIKGNYTDLERPLNIRTSGIAARGLATLCIFAAMNIRLIARHRTKRGLEPHPPTPQPQTSPTTPTNAPDDDHPTPRPEPPNTP